MKIGKTWAGGPLGGGGGEGARCFLGTDVIQITVVAVVTGPITALAWTGSDGTAKWCQRNDPIAFCLRNEWPMMLND